MATHYEHVQYLLLIDGVATALATSEEVTDEYVATLGFSRAYPGLHYPDGVSISINLRAGVLDGSSPLFEIEDVDGTLAGLFAVSLEDAEPLLVKVEAGTAPLGASLYGKCIGTETIGPAGERRRHSCVPGWHVGMTHISEQQAEVTNVAASPVSDDPVIWPGRRACLYRLVRTDDGGWPDLTDESERLAARIWFGTLTGQGEHYAGTWTLRCAGEASWYMGSLGTGVSQTPYPIEVGVQLDEDAGEHVLVGWLDLVSIFDETSVDHIYAPQTTNTALLSGADSYADLVTGVNSFLQILASDNSQGTALNAEGTNTTSGLRYAGPGSEGIAIRWDRGAYIEEYGGPLNDGRCLRMQLLASAKVLKGLGYDPAAQASVDPLDGARFVVFERSPLLIDYPDHWLMTVWSATPYAMSLKTKTAQDPGTSSNWPHTNAFGEWRIWPPIYPGGANVFDLSATLQPFQLIEHGPVFLSSSKGVPLPADPDDPTSPATIPGVGQVTHQGLVAITGPYRDETNPEAEVETITLVARVAWRENGEGSVSTENSQPKLVVYEWPDPKLYGIGGTRTLPSLWGARRVAIDTADQHVMRPLMVLEHSRSSDVAGYELARMLASTGGVGGWYTDGTFTTPAYGLSSPAVLDVGPNDLGLAGIGDEKLGRFTDAEVSSFALAVPAEMIAVAADGQNSFEAAIEQMAESDLFRTKIVLGKVASALEVVRSILAPFGWCISLAGGKFGLFDPFRFQPPLTDSGVITNESLAGKPGDPRSAIPEQSLRKWAPIDRVELDARMDPVTGSHARKEAVLSPDPGESYRSQSIAHKIDGSHLVWPGLPNTKGSSWLPAWLNRWREVCQWWGVQHFEATVTLPAWRHAEFWPGSVVSITNAWLVNPTGASYGVTQAPGYVLSRTVSARTETIELKILVSAKTLRLYAPAAKSFHYVENEGGEGYRLRCDDDYLGMRGNTGTRDVDGFVEPAWSTAGGDADIEIFEFNGVAWTRGIYGVVQGINSEPGNCYIQLTGPLTGARWYRHRHHIVVLRNAAEQTAAWVFNVYAPIGDKNGNYEGSNKSPKFTE